MEQISTKTLINAPTVRIWKTLTDFSQYHEWNPFVRTAEGMVRRGEQLKLQVAHNGQKMSVYKPYIVELEWGRRLVLQGRFFRFPGFIGAEHFLLIETMKGTDSYRFTQKHVFHGTSVAISWKSLAPELREKINAMGEALKERVESKEKEKQSTQESSPPVDPPKKTGIQFAT